eukprot:TRINITY_DN26924_c0_g1_i1.p1 TRINITY_DN26924_c0_g1~~TRINITY_DN26924_c0_g1_i1.p1  ORF type:complete len:474 (-),score=160.78 TRINITY_DN26924_c0_g1_i1:480-1757(-)
MAVALRSVWYPIDCRYRSIQGPRLSPIVVRCPLQSAFLPFSLVNSSIDKKCSGTSQFVIRMSAGSGLSEKDKAAVAKLVQASMKKIEGMPSGYVESLPTKVKARVEALQGLQKEHDELEAKFEEERRALEAKYRELYGPLYTKRFDLVNGVVEAPPSAEATEAGGKDEEDVKGVPEFWLTAMKSNEILQEQITERDESALKYLTDITWSPLPDQQKGFKLDFHFSANPYFKNSVLTKTYVMMDEEDPVLEKAEGTDIQWNAGKNLTVKLLKKKPKKGEKNAKPITKTEDCESFFNFFSPPALPADDEEIEEEEAEALQEQMEDDFEIGSTLKERIIPRAVAWFTGEAAMEEYDDEDEDDEEEDDGDIEEGGEDDEDDEEDDEEEEEDEQPAKQAKATKAKKGEAAAEGGEAGAPKEGDAPECKQQ